MAINRWRDELDGTWHESGDLDASDYEGEAERFRYEYEEREALSADARSLYDAAIAAGACHEDAMDAAE